MKLPRLFAQARPLWLALVLVFGMPAWGAIKPTFSGDLRLRYEKDWDSQTASGVSRADRERARVRARLMGSLNLSEHWSFGARLRTGNRDSQQSPHLTFWSSDEVEDDFEVSFDRYFFQYKDGPATAWAGRNTFPFWQQAEIVWDEDVTPTGAAIVYDHKLSSGAITYTGGAFLLPDGAVDHHGSMVAGQAKYTFPIRSGQLTFATSAYLLQGDERPEFLRNRNGVRDYLIGSASVQWATRIGPTIPALFGVDLIENFESYEAADVAPFAPSQADETSGFVLSALLGQLKKAGDWQAGYFYAYIETLAVNASYAQDDWARFGSGPQSDVTDFKGHEFRAAYAISSTLNVTARVFFVEAITSVQDGNRFRVDLNWKF